MQLGWLLLPSDPVIRYKEGMPAAFDPRLDILPAAQHRLWPELAKTPDHFTLYGGTAVALRLAHRQSADFDFFSPEFSNRACCWKPCRT